MNSFENFLQRCRLLAPILHELKKVGAVPYLVGGGVRDLVIGLPVKDIDIEVHALSLERLEEVLKKFGKVIFVGKQFGVLKLTSLDVDWAIPRKDSKGRKPLVEMDPYLTIEQACRRRDITMNAMAINLHEVSEGLSSFTSVNDMKIIDPYGGLEDIRLKRMRAVDEALFIEDPLRFYRVMQFLARFEMVPDQALNNLCSRMLLHDSVEGELIAKQRVYEEVKKMCLKARRPSLGFRWLHSIGRLADTFPEIASLIGVEQRRDYHPEGDVFEHTMQALDCVATIFKKCEQLKAPCSDSKQFGSESTKGHESKKADDIFFYMCQLICQQSDQEKEDSHFQWVFSLAMICHDMGKAVSSFKDEHGVARAWGHEETGVACAERFLKRITDDSALIGSVKKLVRYHLMPGQLVQQNAHLKAYKHLAVKVAPEAALWHLGIVAWCDLSGRNEHSAQPWLAEKYIPLFEKYWRCIEEANVSTGPEEPLLKGRHIIHLVKPGPEMGKLLEKAYRIQIDESIKDVDELKRRLGV